MQLRPYQESILLETRALMRQGNKSIAIVSATGSGKTILTAYMLKSSAEKGVASFFICHRRELIHQSMAAFKAVGLRFGVVSAGFHYESAPLVKICSISTLIKRWHKIPLPKLIIWDECAHIAAKSWSTLYNQMPNAFHIGLTAVPARLDGKGLGDYFKTMVHGPSVAWLIDNGFLSKYRIFAPATANVDGVRTRAGDYVKEELVAAMDKPSITGCAIREYKKRADGKRAMVFAVSIEHSKHVVGQFQAAGIPAAHVDGETNDIERDAAISSFKSGEIRVLSSVDIFSEGTDIPAVEAAILLRPTQSLSLHLQQLGRVLRRYPGKDCAVILDHAGNTIRHGLPDEQRTWTLEGIQNSKGTGGGVKVKTCPKCFACQAPGASACKFCGFIFEIKPRKVEEKEGELKEIDSEEIARRRERQAQGMAQTREELIAIGRQRGFKNPAGWAHFVLMARRKRRLKNG